MTSTLTNRLLQIKATEKPLILKVDGEFWGDLFSMKDFITMVLDLFIQTGMPRGFVYAAPRGLTKKAQTLLGFARGRREQLMQAQQELDLVFHEFFRLFKESVEQLETEGLLKDKKALLQKVASHSLAQGKNLLQIGQEALERYYELERVPGLEQGPQAALVLSMPERAFHTIVVAPVFELLGHLNDQHLRQIRFLKPEDLIVSDVGASPLGYVNLLPYVTWSVDNIRRSISSIEQLSRSAPSFFMPGSFMSRNEKLACLPLNRGSDISAWLLSLACGGELIYVKRVEDDIPSVKDLLQLQGTIEDSPNSFISSFVLKNLAMTDLTVYPVSVFDLFTRRVIPLAM
jgi:hypothetical protein